jgi:hypothetical protein
MSAARWASCAQAWSGLWIKRRGGAGAATLHSAAHAVHSFSRCGRRAKLLSEERFCGYPRNAGPLIYYYQRYI